MPDAAAQAADTTVNAASAPSHTRRAPSRRVSQAVIGIAAASANRYPLATHCAELSVACRPPLIRSRPTLTTDVSSDDMKAPTTTTAASRHTAALMGAGRFIGDSNRLSI